MEAHQVPVLSRMFRSLDRNDQPRSPHAVRISYRNLLDMFTFGLGFQLLRVPRWPLGLPVVTPSEDQELRTRSK